MSNFSVLTKMAEIIKRISNGGLDPEVVSLGLQAIIDNKFSVARIAPAWDVSTGAKIAAGAVFLTKYATGEEGFSESDIPEVPEITLYEGEVLTLAIYLPDKDGVPGYLRTLDAWWDHFQVSEGLKSEGYNKARWDHLEAREDRIRLIASYEYKPGIRWIVVNTKTYHGESCDKATELAKAEGKTVAGLETIMLLAQCPKWAESWNGKESPYPNATALQVFYNIGWSRSVCLDRWDDDLGVELGAGWSGGVVSHWASPVFREC